MFEHALVLFPEGSPNRWEIIADQLQKSAGEVREHYEALVHDVIEIESGRVHVPHYMDDSAVQISFESKHGENERKRGTPWSESEHKLFLVGLKRYGKGDWRSISRNVVVTRTPTQVASHAQKYFLRQNSGKKERKRSSIHDITTVDTSLAMHGSNMDWNGQHDSPVQPQQQQIMSEFDGSASDELKASFPQVSALGSMIVWTSFTPSSATSCQTRFPALTSPPVLSHAFFADLRVIPLSTRSIRNRVYASINNIDVATPSHQDADPEATIVQLSFGDRLGALIDTMRALKDFGLGVTKGTVSTEGSVKQTKFSITKLDTGRKVEDPDSLEQIRLTIINNLLKYHPECSDQLAMGESFGIKAPQKKIDVDIATHIHVKEDGPKRSLLCIETADRPGLVVEMIKVMADINIDVESAEIDTEGLVAKDKFHVSYQGQALNSSLSQVLVNCLRYFLRRPETDIDSY
ncbi:hypothetical protein HID58_089833 [Brassica napus]|uniref:Uncharacterized protein n=1 Tax=Brassica napus TaxID=3708 RepID=A0ABQ7Y054_BRANA|nr:hypothetical protein HID58_089833 [Brassica napus]